MKQRYALLLLLVLLSIVVIGQTIEPEEGGGGIVYGSGIGVIVQAPTGWIFDSESARPQGIPAVMYPVGSSWSDFTELIYINFGTLEEGQSLETFITNEIKDFKTHSPDLVVKRSAPIAMKGDKSAIVNLLTGDKWGNHEAIAYAVLDSDVAMFVLSCQSATSFEQYLPVFKDVVSSSVLVKMKFE